MGDGPVPPRRGSSSRGKTILVRIHNLGKAEGVGLWALACASGVRAYLRTRRLMWWLTPRRLRAITVGLGVMVASATLVSGSG
jgi:hypothetical protein